MFEPRTRSLSRALTAIALALLVWAPAGALAEFEESFEFDARTLTVVDLIGEITVEGHAGSAFVVAVHVQGADADPEQITFEAEEGGAAQLMIRFPVEEERRFVYPRLGGNSRTTFNPRSRGSGGWWNELLGRDRIEVRGSGRGMEVWADVHIKVPADGELRVVHGVGEIRSDDVNGHLELMVRSGHVVANRTNGSLLVDTGSGHVEVDEVTGDLDVDTGSGHVDATAVRQAKRIRVDTGSGHVRLTQAQGDEVEIDTGSGNVELDRVASSVISVDTGSGRVEGRDVETDDLTVDTGSGSVDIELNRMGDGDFVVDTGSGSITLWMPEPASAHVEAETGSGGIDVDIADVEYRHKKRDEVEFEVGDARARVRLETGSGRIRIAER